jgi:nitroreductase
MDGAPAPEHVFSTTTLPLDTLHALFEAARFTPSSEGVLPWLFVYAAERPTRQRALSLLTEADRAWATGAALLVFAFARRAHPETGTPLHNSAFDTGAACLALSQRARELGLSCRSASRVARDRTERVLGVPAAEYEPHLMLAVGYAPLSDDGAPSSAPPRQHHFVFNGRYLCS